MNKTEFEKYLYKEKPKAFFVKIQNGIAHYIIEDIPAYFHFEIPINDMGDAPFYNKMDAQLLRRWIKE